MVPRILLFDWVSGGHHALYLRRLTEALRPRFEVILAAPDEVLADVADLQAEAFSLGRPRPAPSHAQSASWGLRNVLPMEVGLMASAAAQVRADHIFHTYADAILPRLVPSARLPAPLTILLFYPRAHYPKIYGTRLTPGERARAGLKEAAVALWRRRPDARALFTLDAEAASRWSSRAGAPAYWLPEPPIPDTQLSQVETHAPRRGCVLYGALAERKGIDLLARALSSEPNSLQITLAGEAETGFLPMLQAYAAAMSRSGATVEIRDYRHTELDGLRVLAAARCALLPYPRHDGMSRVLLEAAAVGTPVVVHDRGLLGYLVRRHNLGVAVDCTDCRAFRAAIATLVEDDSAQTRFSKALARFSASFSNDRFTANCVKPFGDDPSSPRASISV